MGNITLVLLSAGNATRFRKNIDIKKQWLYTDDKPLWQYVAKRFMKMQDFSKVIIVSSPEDLTYMRKFDDSFIYVEGGEHRQESIKNALKFVDSSYVLISDVARACVTQKMVEEILENRDKADVVVPVLDVADTVYYKGKTIDRDEVKLIQTPQLSKTDILKKAISKDKLFTDESSAIRDIGGSVFFTKGSIFAKKITTFADLEEIECLKAPKEQIFVGNGYDVHRFCKNKDMYLGGVKIESELGFEAHSDGDVAIHALIDSLLGAIGAGDIGELFPDSSDEFKDIDSKELLNRVVKFIRGVGYEIVNVDITIQAQKPKLSPYKEKMSEVLAKILKIEKIRVNVKATTTEKLGFVGRGEGVAVVATSLVKIYNWMKK